MRNPYNNAPSDPALESAPSFLPFCGQAKGKASIDQLDHSDLVTKIVDLPKDILIYTAKNFLNGLSLAAMEVTRKSFFPSPTTRNQLWEKMVRNEISDDPRLPKEMSWKQYYGQAYKIFLQIIATHKKLRELKNADKVASREYRDIFLFCYDLFIIIIVRGYDKLGRYLLNSVSEMCIQLNLNSYFGASQSIKTFLHLAVFHERPYLVKLLLEQGAKVDILGSLFSCKTLWLSCDDYGTPLAFAAALGNLECMNILLEHKANINFVSRNDGNTPLHRAAENGQREAIALLLERGARTNQRDNKGELPIDLAEKHGHIACVELLQAQVNESSAKMPKKQRLTP